MNYLLGLDIGTSGTKTALFDEEGRTIAQAVFGYDLYQPQAGWAEQNPEDWWNAVKKGIKSVLEKSGADKNAIKGIGLSGQMHGLVLLDKDGKVIRNSIIWCDQRTEKECEYLTEKIGRDKLIEITGNPAMTGFTLAKLLWVRKNEPENYKKTAKILLPKDYIRYRLTGVYASEVSDASGMQMLDINKRNWSDELLEALEIDKNLLAPVYESADVTGTISDEVSEETGLSTDTVVAGGAGDQAAGAIGCGIAEEGIISTVVGSSGVVFAATDKPVFDKGARVHTLCHAVPGKWHVMGVTQAAGLSFKWYKDNFCHREIKEAESSEKNVYDILTEEAESSVPGANGMLYLPYLMGERTPHIDPNVKGGFFGVSLINSHADFTRSVLEGVVYSLKNCLDIINEMGIEAKDIRISGGGAESRVWSQIFADVFEEDLSKVKAEEGPALGAAILAGVSAGLYPSVEEACRKIVKTTDKTLKNTEVSSKYREIYKKYNSLYDKIKDI